MSRPATAGSAVVPLAEGVSAATQWRLNPKADLHWRQLDGDWVVHENRSGMTHQLGALRAAVLMVFETGTVLGLAGLQHSLATEFGLVDLGHDALHDLVKPLCQIDLPLPASLPPDAVA